MFNLQSMYIRIYVCIYIYVSRVSNFRIQMCNCILIVVVIPPFVSSPFNLQIFETDTCIWQSLIDRYSSISFEDRKDNKSWSCKISFNNNQPRRTFLIIAPLTTSSPSRDSIHFLLQRYCSNGRRYFPQKSTNLTCSTLLLKNTPVTKRINFLFLKITRKMKIAISTCALSRIIVYCFNLRWLKCENNSKEKCTCIHVQ